MDFDPPIHPTALAKLVAAVDNDWTKAHQLSPEGRVNKRGEDAYRRARAKLEAEQSGGNGDSIAPWLPLSRTTTTANSYALNPRPALTLSNDALYGVLWRLRARCRASP